MCRITAVLGKGSSLYSIYPEIVKGLYGAARYDPYSVDLFGPGEESHKDGWGRLNIQLYEGDLSISHIRSMKPIYKEKPPIRLSLSPLEEFIEDTFFIDFMHARAGSTGMPKNFFSIHPFKEETKEGYILYLMHNGAVYKELLLKELGIDVDSEYASLYTDSYFLAKYLSRYVSDKLNREIVKDLIRFTKTALNLGIVLITKQEIYILLGSYYKKGDKPKEMRNYYKMYFVEYNESVIYLSSTIVDFDEYRPKNILKWEEIENGRYDIYRVKLKEKPKLEKMDRVLVKL